MDDAKTVWCGNLADQVTEELLYELFLQVAPLERVKIPTDREGRKSNFGFITFKHEVSVPYAVQLLNGIKMFEKSLNVKPRNGGAQQEKQNAQHNTIQRSLSYPTDVYNHLWQNQDQHIRFNDSSDMSPQCISYDSLVQLGQLMNVNYDYQENNYANQYGNSHGHNSGKNHGNGNNRQQWERNDYGEKDKDRDRREYDRPRHEYERERERRNDYSNNHHNRRNNERKNNQHYDRNGGRRPRRRF